jgi:hypothetical protein
MGIHNNALIGSSGQGGYNLTKSLRFRSSASAYLNRTPASAGNRRTFTFSAWAKIGGFGTRRIIFGTGDTSLDNSFEFEFYNDDKLRIVNYVAGAQINLITTSVYRDPSAWYHLVMAVDTTQATDTNRVKLYVNGTQVTSFSTATYPSQNFDTALNTTSATGIGRAGTYNDLYYNGYLAELNFIDGQALTPSSFGETSTTTGVWIPKKYTGTYGTNGFYLPFTDTTSTSTLGTDFSGNSNTWTVNNISLTSGSTYDSMLDVPTLTSATQANYCVGNWLNQSDLDILKEGNLYWKVDNERAVTGTLSMTTGKWYWEATISAIQNYIEIGIVGTNARFSGPNNFVPGSLSTGYGYRSNATKINNNTTASYGATYAANDVIGVAFDADAGTLTFYKNNSSQGTAYSSIPSNFYVAYDYGGPAGGTTGAYFNFGQRPFAYTPPTGFVALNTFNLPTPTIGATASTTANKYFDATTYTGNGGTQTVVNAGGFQPDMLWIKSRSAATDHALQDSVRGMNLALYPNLTIAEISAGYASTTSNGFLTAGAVVNTNGATYVGWQWRASNATAVTNTAGSITSTVSTNTTAGFSIVTYTGNGGTSATVGHGLGVAPSMIIYKVRSNALRNWIVYHVSLGSTRKINLNLTDADEAENGNFGGLSPTSTTFGVGYAATNGSSETFVAYCFAPIAGYSAFGSYTGNGSTDGPFVFTGFRPRWVMFKQSSSSGAGWLIYDSARNTYNLVDLYLQANQSNAEAGNSTDNPLDFLSNGFKLRYSNSATNQNGATYIYACFAENPFKYANAR